MPRRRASSSAAEVAEGTGGRAYVSLCQTDPALLVTRRRLTSAIRPLVPQASSQPHSVATSSRPSTFAALPRTSSRPSPLAAFFDGFFPPPAAPPPGSLLLSTPYPSFQNLRRSEVIHPTRIEFDGLDEDPGARVMNVCGGMGVDGGGGRRLREWIAEAWALQAGKWGRTRWSEKVSEDDVTSRQARTDLRLLEHRPESAPRTQKEKTADDNIYVSQRMRDG